MNVARRTVALLCVRTRFRRFRAIICVVLLAVISKLVFAHIQLDYRLEAFSSNERQVCRTLELFDSKEVFTEGNLSSKRPCFSTTFYDIPEVESETTTTPKRREQKDVFVFVVESLGWHKFLNQMPLTKHVLEEFGVTWFTGMHVRNGGTRENLPSLLFGKPLAYNITVKQTAHSSNYSATFDLTNEGLQNAIWRVAQRKGYKSLYGSTSCNMLLGTHHLVTSDGHVWHDVHREKSDFTDLFPPGAYHTPSDTDRMCDHYSDAPSAEAILRCSSTGPYHHKFLEYYKAFSTHNLGSPLFTIAHLMETHGNYIYWPLDYHTSRFLHWLLKKHETIVIFMGDHGETYWNDTKGLGTPLGIALPRKLRPARQTLRLISDAMVLLDDVYVMLRSYLESTDIFSAVKMLQHKVELNSCSKHANLAHCLCEKHVVNYKVPKFSTRLLNRAVEHIKKASDGANTCEVLQLLKYRNVRSSPTDLSMEVVFNGPVFAFKFMTEDNFHTKQLTRYSNQIPCTPDGYHAEYCLCNRTAFEEQNSLFNIQGD